MKAAICVLALTFLAVSTQAATIASDCTPNPENFSGGTGDATVMCPAFSVAGATLTGVTLQETANFNRGMSGGENEVIVTFDALGPSTVTWTGNGALTVDGQTLGGDIDSQTATTGVTNANFATDFSVEETSVVNTGTVANSTARLQIEYTYTPATTTPEPSVVSLFAIGLCALPFVTRRRWFRQQ